MADESLSMRILRVRKPLFVFDPGWLFVAAGVALVAAAVLVPPQVRLHGFQQRRDRMHTAEATAVERLKAYATFLEALEEEDPQLVRRLVAAQLNLVPVGYEPVLLARSASAPVTEWIESTVAPAPRVVEPFPQTLLTRLTTGPRRHWLLAFACGCLFVGLIFGPEPDAGHSADDEDDG